MLTRNGVINYCNQHNHPLKESIYRSLFYTISVQYEVNYLQVQVNQYRDT